MGIPAAGSGTVDEVMAVAEHLNETLRIHVAIHDFLRIVFSHRGQQIEQFVVDVLIASHVPVRAIHLPKKRDDLWGLSVSCFFFVDVDMFITQKNSGHLRNQS